MSHLAQFTALPPRLPVRQGAATFVVDMTYLLMDIAEWLEEIDDILSGWAAPVDLLETYHTQLSAHFHLVSSRGAFLDGVNLEDDVWDAVRWSWVLLISHLEIAFIWWQQREYVLVLKNICKAVLLSAGELFAFFVGAVIAYLHSNFDMICVRFYCL